MRDTIEALGTKRAALHYLLQIIYGGMALITVWAIACYALCGIKYVAAAPKIEQISFSEEDMLHFAAIVLLAMILGYIISTRKVELNFESGRLLLGAVIGAAITTSLTNMWHNGFGILSGDLYVIFWVVFFLVIKFLLQTDAKKIEEYGCLSIETRLTDAGKVVVIDGQTIPLSDQTARMEQQPAVQEETDLEGVLQHLRKPLPKEENQ
ncbi:MAG: hypothetical protein MR303_11035 [Emergencia sp.]|nr:hypothetical protein [Emergencia sp.]